MMTPRRWAAVALLTILAAPVAVSAQTSTAKFDVPGWAYPGSTPPYAPARPPYDNVTRLALPGSSQSFTLAEIKNSYGVPDWFPESHPAMPEQVARGRARKSQACGFCHLPDGQGRSENASLAGLTPEYIIRQVKDFRARKRGEAKMPWAFLTAMQTAADSVSDDDLAIAARYFAAIRPKPRVKVLERDVIQKTFEANGLHALNPAGGTESLGNRIVEITEDLERHDLRDPRPGFISYVPVGSIERGRRIAASGGSKAACASCHGPSLLGSGAAPLIAGRSPAYVLRQLMAFRTGARNTEAGAPMRAVTERLTLDDMIAVAAYVGSRPVK